MDYKNTIENTTALIGALVLTKKGKLDLAKLFLAKLNEDSINNFVSSLTEVVKVMSEGSDLEDLSESDDDEEDDDEDDDDEDEIMNDYEDDSESDDEEDIDNIIDDMEESGELDKSVASILKGLGY